MKNFSQMPIATYRLQLNQNFTFRHVASLAEYFHELGISHCYLSPLLKAKPGSAHGYDIIDHSQLNPELGTEQDFEELIKILRVQNMGVICDIVPNHMYIGGACNHWWMDILENGQASPYASYFDINWHSQRPELINKVFLPLLDKQYGEALESQELKIVFQNGAFFVALFDFLLPTDPWSWNLILEPVHQTLQDVLTKDDDNQMELKSIITAIMHLPCTTDLNTEKVQERLREKEVIKLRLAKLLVDSQTIADKLAEYLVTLNGHKGDPKSFDALENFLNGQPYRLCFWRVANDEINYRRFFDIFEFAGIRTEQEDVFKASHALILDLVKKGWVDGLRIDHIDGLRNPEHYLKNLQESNDSLKYMIVEKVLLGKEKLNPEWPIDGTVGYDFLNLLNNLFVVQANKKVVFEIYRSFTNESTNVFDLIYACKRLILLVSMSSELYVLSRYLDSIAEQHRSSRDFTEASLRAALGDVISCFPVYRSYIRSEAENIREEDRQYIVTAISRAKRLNPAINASIFDFIQKVLLLEDPLGLDEEQKKKRRDFVMRFQQLTPPAMGKGLEDTAYYRFYPLASLNEVGGDLLSFGISLEAFQKANQERGELWPCAMLTTSTHDTKRSEDVRARINALSEIPDQWRQALTHWSQLNQQHKIKEGEEQIPDANEEYLLYQTLVGAWPLDSSNHSEFITRIQAYIEKAIKEAKINSSWINPNHRYDIGVHQFIQRILNLDSVENPFINEFKTFIPKVIAAGMLNSLSQVILKLTLPGVPDIYQGNEIWDFSLVDPDNRRPVDFEVRRTLLKSLFEGHEGERCALLQQLMHNPEDGRIKLFLTAMALRLRQKLPSLFQQGSYLPLVVEGDKQNHVIAFIRAFEKQAVLVVSTRFYIPLMQEENIRIPVDRWKDTYVIIPEEWKKMVFYNVLTGKEAPFDTVKGALCLRLEKVLDPLPYALLESA